VNEVIESTRIGFSLLAHAIEMPGTAAVLGELSFAEGHSLFVGAHPEQPDTPSPFDTIRAGLQASHKVLLIGLQNDSGRFVINPEPDRPVQPTDQLVYIAKKAVLPSA
jgi:hypothetical protein